MNYIQRLLDGTGGAFTRASATATTTATGPAPVASVGAGGNASPVLSADPRLALFPDIADPAPVLVPAAAATPLMVGDAIAARTPGPLAPDPLREIPGKPQTHATAPPPGTRRETDAPMAGRTKPEDATPRRISRLQQWAESDPLPQPLTPQRIGPHPAPQQAVGIRTSGLSPPQPETTGSDPPPPYLRDSRIPSGSNSPAAPSPLPSLSDRATPDAPWPIASGQFQPLDLPDPSPAPATPPVAAPGALPWPHLQPPSPATDPTPVAGADTAPPSRPVSPPLTPVPHDTPSPLARMPQQAPPLASGDAPSSFAHHMQDAAPPPRQPDARPSSQSAPRPRPATAEGQSVIGPLSARRFVQWQPRQEGF